MAYKYEQKVVSFLKEVSSVYNSGPHREMADEVEEVYAKAKAFDEIAEVFKDSTLDDEIVMQTILKNLRKLEGE